MSERSEIEQKANEHVSTYGRLDFLSLKNLYDQRMKDYQAGFRAALAEALPLINYLHVFMDENDNPHIYKKMKAFLEKYEGEL